MKPPKSVRLNNDWGSRYSRQLIARRPEFKNAFKLRALKSEEKDVLFSAPDALQIEFAAFDRDHPEIGRLFECFAEQDLPTGYCSSAAIISKIRAHLVAQARHQAAQGGAA